jgi:glycosyltransferase involved in cell wall biosynthesis
MTNDAVYKNDGMNQYVADNQHWDYPQCTKRSVPHVEVLKNISKSRVFVSTWPKESWGITAMESLGCGVPLILLTDSSDEHSSESIAADKSHYIKLNRRKTSTKEFNEAVESLSAYSLEKRKEIYDKTNKKHSKKEWVKQFTTMIDDRMRGVQPKASLTEFFK